MRLFTAITLTGQVQREIMRLIARLEEEQVGSLRLVSPENAHVTLCFLGEVQEDKLPMLHGELEAVCSAVSRFEFTLAGLGAFPSVEAPRILWVGLAPPEPFRQLAAAISNAARKMAIQVEEREFHPHITIGRLKEQRYKEKAQAFIGKTTVREVPPCKIESADLYRSIQNREGSKYEMISRFNLS
ncbi:MAG: RNA 2',3'-cyclic phosphodiesterase [Deltaproteobacteria bacterium]|nr:RNA 2',3'-cyclic phosphodiesterase [Deltaproteobacteria bacterium]